MASIIYDDKELMKALLEAGVHFGHQTKRWNPKMKPYIFVKRNGIYIIDLRHTISKLKEAYHAMKEVVMNGGSVLFIGTKKQAQNAIREEAQRCGMPFMSKRWLGGTLTNFSTIRKSVDKMKKLQKKLELEKDTMIKKEYISIEKQVTKMKAFYEGIQDMKRLPDAVWIVDAKREFNALLEAKKLGTTIFGVADTNCDPDLMDWIVPGNDDAIRAVRLLTSLMSDAIIEGSTLAAKKDMDMADVSELKNTQKSPEETFTEDAAVTVAKDTVEEALVSEVKAAETKQEEVVEPVADKKVEE